MTQPAEHRAVDPVASIDDYAHAMAAVRVFGAVKPALAALRVAPAEFRQSQVWAKRMADEVAAGKSELTSRFVAAFDAAAATIRKPTPPPDPAAPEAPAPSAGAPRGAPVVADDPVTQPPATIAPVLAALVATTRAASPDLDGTLEAPFAPVGAAIGAGLRLSRERDESARDAVAAARARDRLGRRGGEARRQAARDGRVHAASVEACAALRLGWRAALRGAPRPRSPWSRRPSRHLAVAAVAAPPRVAPPGVAPPIVPPVVAPADPRAGAAPSRPKSPLAETRAFTSPAAGPAAAVSYADAASMASRRQRPRLHLHSAAAPPTQGQARARPQVAARRDERVHALSAVAPALPFQPADPVLGVEQFASLHASLAAVPDKHDVILSRFGIRDDRQRARMDAAF